MKFVFTIYSPYVCADVVQEVDIDDDELEGKTEDQKELYISDICYEWMLQTVQYGWKKVE